MSKDVYMLCDVNGNQEKRKLESQKFVVNGVISTDESVKITFDKTAEDLYDAHASGKSVIIVVRDEENNSVVELAWSFSAEKEESSVGTVVYKFFATDNDGDSWTTDDLKGSDYVVLSNSEN